MKIINNGSNVYYVTDDKQSFNDKNILFSEEVSTCYNSNFQACINKCSISTGLVDEKLRYVIITVNDLFFVFDLMKLDENHANKGVIFLWFEKIITENFGCQAFLKIRSELLKAMLSYSKKN